jgi:hypothetical protein
MPRAAVTVSPIRSRHLRNRKKKPIEEIRATRRGAKKKKLIIGKAGLPLHQSMGTGRLAELSHPRRKIVRQITATLFIK